MDSRDASISTPHTRTTEQFEAIRTVTTAPETEEKELLAIRDRLAQEMEAVNARLRGRLITPEQAREIIGDELFFGVDSANKLYGTSLTPEAIANLPFNLTEAQVENAARLGHTIALHVPVSMLNIQRSLAQTVYKNDPFANTPDVLEWREASVKLIPGTLSKDYLQQTELLIQYIKERMYKGKPLPAQYEEAVKEFEEQKSQIQALMRIWRMRNLSGESNWRVALNMFAKLKITKLIRPTPISRLQDIKNLTSVDPYILPQGIGTWTSSQTIYGYPICIDNNGCISAGEGISCPPSRYANYGASFSRSLSG